jgi:hypothetical protein
MEGDSKNEIDEADELTVVDIVRSTIESCQDQETPVHLRTVCNEAFILFPGISSPTSDLWRFFRPGNIAMLVDIIKRHIHDFPFFKDECHPLIFHENMGLLQIEEFGFWLTRELPGIYKKVKSSEIASVRILDIRERRMILVLNVNGRDMIVKSSGSLHEYEVSRVLSKNRISPHLVEGSEIVLAEDLVWGYPLTVYNRYPHFIGAMTGIVLRSMQDLGITYNHRGLIGHIIINQSLEPRIIDLEGANWDEKHENDWAQAEREIIELYPRKPGKAALAIAGLQRYK